MLLKTLSGPIIGAVIGYFTNYIAVKMLFYPRKEIKIFGHTLPFTPGAIPKGKPRLAKAVGNIVANTLLTGEDIKKKILSSEMETIVTEKIMGVLSADLRSNMLKLFSSEEKYDVFKAGITDKLTDQIVDAVENMEIGRIIAEEGTKVIKEKAKGTMLAMFLSDGLIASFAQPIGEEIEKFVSENGKSYIEPEVAARVNSLETYSVVSLCEAMEMDRDALQDKIVSLYHAAVEKAVAGIVNQLDISGLIEDKINEMNVEELEKMVLTVMKKELDMIVNLGALVGALLGIFNMFF